MNTNIKTVPAIWFSRHVPTQEQLEEIEKLGYFLADATNLGSREILCKADAEAVVEELLNEASVSGARAAFGVFPTPILAIAFSAAEWAIWNGDWHGGEVALFASHNVQRTQEGGKPTFQHAAWQQVGSIR
jgi:hypothetical protein